VKLQHATKLDQKNAKQKFASYAKHFPSLHKIIKISKSKFGLL